jgi:hypothetical protein
VNLQTAINLGAIEGNSLIEEGIWKAFIAAPFLLWYEKPCGITKLYGKPFVTKYSSPKEGYEKDGNGGAAAKTYIQIACSYQNGATRF